MKKTRRIFTRALIALAFAAIGTGAWAVPKECGMVGTWSGMDAWGGPDVGWFGVNTEGTASTRGSMILDWIWVDPTVLILGAARLAPGRGVWEQVAKGQYKYAWYTYGISEGGTPLFMVRVSGTAANDGCDKIDISYSFQVFTPLDLDPPPPAEQKFFPHQFPATDTPIYATTGTAVQYRVPLVTLP